MISFRIDNAKTNQLVSFSQIYPEYEKSLYREHSIIVEEKSEKKDEEVEVEEEEEEEEEEPVKENNFAQFEIKNIQILGCFRKKNNFID